MKTTTKKKVTVHFSISLSDINVVYSELLSLMSQLKMESDDEEEGEEETEEVEEWYHQTDDQPKMESARADSDEQEETEEMKNLSRIYNQMISDLMDDINEQYFWGEDSEEEDYDLQRECAL